MEFVQFCRAHGILIDSLPPMGIWKRFPTDDHPHKRNGAVKFMGDHGFVQNHATQTEVSVWKSDRPHAFDPSQLARAAQKAEQDTERRQQEAAKKAQFIMDRCDQARHAYLKAKGFDDQIGFVWPTDGKQILVIPMRIAGKLVGCQLIDEEGGKKFLFGQRTAGAEFVFDNKGPHIYCEGYATALSIRAALKSLKKKYTLHVCFSAGNMEKVARIHGEGFVVADNDESKTGEESAKRIGFPYFLPPTVGQDFNDFHREVGLLRASMALDKLLRSRKVG
jgi:putative DNA primase/helicase